MHFSIGSTLIGLLVAALAVNGFKIHRPNAVTRCSALKASLEMPPAPVDEKAKMLLTVSGKSVDSALFRAELKKELTFFRSCHGIYNIFGEDKATIVAEGKTKQLEKFIKWLNLLTKKFEERTPTFVGPPIVIQIEEVKWESFSGSLKGFTMSNEPPVIANAAAEGEDMIEARNMMGTDEGAV
jgi:acylphosphatase